jgi:nitrite reductase/ring-hydroxylating ferredoxin subunit
VSDNPAQQWTAVCTTGDLAPGAAVTVPDACPPIAVFNVDGDICAVDDTCTHSEYSLSEGYLEGDEIECELHFATFSVRTGAALTAPAVDPLGTYPVKVENDTIYVAIGARCVLQQFRA